MGGGIARHLVYIACRFKKNQQEDTVLVDLMDGTSGRANGHSVVVSANSAHHGRVKCVFFRGSLLADLTSVEDS